MYDFFKEEELDELENSFKEHLLKLKSKEKTIELLKLGEIVKSNIQVILSRYIKEFTISTNVLNEDSVQVSVNLENGKKVNDGYIIYDKEAQKYKFIQGTHFVEKGFETSQKIIEQELDNWLENLISMF